LAVNRRARHDYHVLEKLECGIELRGTEVKSCRAGKASLVGTYADIEAGEVWVKDLRIEPFSHGNRFNHDPVRPRKLLLHRVEIHRLTGQTQEKGRTLIPLRLYLKRGRVKLELGLCKGKDVIDKRETLKRRAADREAQRAVAEHLRR
jgi:SsrA-binding protein